MKRIIGLSTFVAIACLGISSKAEAAIVNGGFEDGLTGFEAIGDVTTVGADFGVRPSEGNFQAFLSTAFQEVVGLDENFVPIVGGNAAIAPFISGVPNLEEFLELPSDFLGNSPFGNLATGDVIEGSAIRRSLQGRAGQTLTFAYNFLTDEFVGENADPTFNDFAFVTVKNNAGFNQILPLASTVSSTFRASDSVFFDETGYQRFSFTFPTSDEYTFGIGVVDVGEPTIISGLLVDEVEVPETTPTLGLLAGGILGGMMIKRSRQIKRNLHS